MSETPVTGTVRGGKGRYGEWVESLREQVLLGPGTLDSEIRVAAAAGSAVPRELSDYVEKVRARACEVEHRDVESLREAGYSEDQIFELTVSAALGAGFGRLESALALLGEE
ncbi:MAG: hypothetical protein ACE5I4_08630 [Thermoplasmata archaeon]